MQSKNPISSIQDLLAHSKHLYQITTSAITLFYLDQHKRVLAQKTLQNNPPTATEISLTSREIFQPALRQQAYFMAIVQKRVSGIVYPQKDLLKQVGTIEKISTYLGISLLDYILLSEKDYFSFRENGLLYPLK